MEDGLRALLKLPIENLEEVLILVLMEDGLRAVLPSDAAKLKPIMS